MITKIWKRRSITVLILQKEENVLLFSRKLKGETSCISTMFNHRRDWGQEEKGMTEDEMAGRHHRLGGHEFEWTPGVGDGQGGLAYRNSWGRKESDMTERLNWLNWLTEGTPRRADILHYPLLPTGEAG